MLCLFAWECIQLMLQNVTTCPPDLSPRNTTVQLEPTCASAPRAAHFSYRRAIPGGVQTRKTSPVTKRQKCLSSCRQAYTAGSCYHSSWWNRCTSMFYAYKDGRGFIRHWTCWNAFRTKGQLNFIKLLWVVIPPSYNVLLADTAQPLVCFPTYWKTLQNDPEMHCTMVIERENGETVTHLLPGGCITSKMRYISSFYSTVIEHMLDREKKHDRYLSTSIKTNVYIQHQ